MRLISLLAIAVASASAVAQNQNFVLPIQGLAATNNIPFAAGIGRYQQWYSQAEVVAGLGGVGLTGPLRFLQVDFLAGTGQQTATTLDMEVRIAHAAVTGLSNSFDNDMQPPVVTIVPRRTVNLTTGGPGSPVVVLPFVTQFTWDATRAIVIDIKVFGNGRANQPFPYDFQAATGSAPGTMRGYTLGNANAQFATNVQPGWGLYTRFTARPGAMVPFGSGCPGEGFITPVGTASPLASPGVTWNHQLSQASSQRLAMWVIGDNRTQWGPLPLPLDLQQFIGAPGCLLLTNPVVNLFTTTVGGGAGAGIANLPIQLPPTTGYIGMAVYTQWFVADPLAVNGVLSASAGLWTTVAPVGG